MNELPLYGLLSQPPTRDWELYPPRNDEEYDEYMRDYYKAVGTGSDHMRTMMEQNVRDSMGGVYIPPHSRDDYDRNLSIANQRRGLLFTPEDAQEMYPRSIPPSPYNQLERKWYY